MKKLAIILLAALTLGGGLAFAEPSPKGLEWAFDFTSENPVEIRLAQKSRAGVIYAAQFTTIAASDSIQVVVNDNDLYLGPGEWGLGSADQEVNNRLRFTPGGNPLAIGTPIYSILIYGPATAEDVTVNIWAEY